MEFNWNLEYVQYRQSHGVNKFSGMQLVADYGEAMSYSAVCSVLFCDIDKQRQRILLDNIYI